MTENMSIKELQEQMKNTLESARERVMKEELTQPEEVKEAVVENAPLYEETESYQTEIEDVSPPVKSLQEVALDKTPSLVNTNFGHALESVKLDVLSEAAAEDDKFVETVKQNLKSAAVKNTEVEEKLADFEKQKVDFASETLETQQKRNKHVADEHKWENREKRRQYHYNGVKPIMLFVGITEPMNLFMLYFLTAILTPFFLIAKFLQGTLGVIICGAMDKDRSKAVKGFLWTLLAVIVVLILLVVIYLFLKWQGLIY